jgi:hypothetical protein
MFGLGGGFLLISPTLRSSVMEDINAGFSFMEVHSPYSYVGAGVAGLAMVLMMLVRGSRPR